ncbi:MAG: hypothetical protein RI894_1880 [Bacteroidota bacterium]
MKKIVLFAAIFVATFTAALAQKPKFGIKAGLNVFTLLNSNPEKDANGATLDKMDISSGFQVGITAQLPLSEIFGLQGELLYTQRGGIYKYKGPGYLNVNTASGDIYNITGTATYLLRHSNGYLEVPLMVYVKPVKHLKIEAGISPMFLISAIGQGEYYLSKPQFNGVSLKDTNLIVSINADYLGPNDTNQQYDQSNQVSSVSGGGKQVAIQGDNYYLPTRVGAYYFNTNRSAGNTFRTFDLSANVGLVYNFTTGLNISLRAGYGLLDTTPAEQDVYLSKNTGTTIAPTTGSIGKSTDFQPLQRENATHNFNVGLTVGFSF